MLCDRNGLQIWKANGKLAQRRCSDFGLDGAVHNSIKAKVYSWRKSGLKNKNGKFGGKVSQEAALITR